MNAVTELFDVVRLGDVDRLRKLIATDPALAGARDETGLSVILQARYRSRLDMLEVLLAASARRLRDGRGRRRSAARSAPR